MATILHKHFDMNSLEMKSFVFWFSVENHSKESDSQWISTGLDNGFVSNSFYVYYDIMKRLSDLLALCDGNPPVTGGFTK